MLRRLLVDYTARVPAGRFVLAGRHARHLVVDFDPGRQIEAFDFARIAAERTGVRARVIDGAWCPARLLRLLDVTAGQPGSRPWCEAEFAVLLATRCLAVARGLATAQPASDDTLGAYVLAAATSAETSRAADCLEDAREVLRLAGGRAPRFGLEAEAALLALRTTPSDLPALDTLSAACVALLAALRAGADDV